MHEKRISDARTRFLAYGIGLIRLFASFRAGRVPGGLLACRSFSLSFATAYCCEMRAVKYFVTKSLDGPIARQDGGVDWLFMDQDYGMTVQIGFE